MVDLPNYSGFLEMLKVFKLNVTYNFQNENYNYKKTIESLKNDMSIGALYISNPRNPFGDYLSNIKEIIDYCSDNKIILFIDEAYIEFYNEKKSDVFLLKEKNKNNIILGRTFSKAYGLASIRCGYLINFYIDFDNELKNLNLCQPFHMNEYSIKCALKAYSNYYRVEKGLKLITREKEKLYKFLDSYNIKYIKTVTNYLIVFINKDLEKYLNEKNILIENLSNYKIVNTCYRVTIGNKKEMKYLTKCIKQFMEVMSNDL